MPLPSIRSKRGNNLTRARRQALRRQFPHLPPQALAHHGKVASTGGVGFRALREWLASVEALERVLRNCCGT